MSKPSQFSNSYSELALKQFWVKDYIKLFNVLFCKCCFIHILFLIDSVLLFWKSDGEFVTTLISKCHSRLCCLSLNTNPGDTTKHVQASTHLEPFKTHSGPYILKALQVYTHACTYMQAVHTQIYTRRYAGYHKSVRSGWRWREQTTHLSQEAQWSYHWADRSWRWRTVN